MVGRFLRGLILLLAVLIFAAVGIYILFSDPDVSDVEAASKYGTPPSQFVTLPSGAKVHFRDQGQRNGPALVMLHGSNASLHSWEPWVAQIGDQFRMISLDMPSHGLTGAVPSNDYSENGMSKFLDEFTKVMGLERFALAGNSMGGSVAARFAIDNPERLTHLILVDAGGMPTTSPRGSGLGLALVRIPVLQYAFLYISPRALFEDGLKQAVANDALVTPEMVDRYWQLGRKTGNRAASLKRIQAPQDTYIQDYASQIKTPTLILWGELDTFAPHDMGQAFNAAIKGSKLVTFKNTGHLPMEEVPDQSARIVREFLAPTPVAMSSE